MADTLVLVQTVAAVLTAVMATGVFGLAYRAFKLVQEHDRILFGEETVQGWDGIVPVVQKNRKCIENLKDEVDDDIV